MPNKHEVNLRSELGRSAIYNRTIILQSSLDSLDDLGRRSAANQKAVVDSSQYFNSRTYIEQTVTNTVINTDSQLAVSSNEAMIADAEAQLEDIYGGK